MPIPKPQSGEKQDDFISRCMGDGVMNNEYPENGQRAAICHGQWRKMKTQSNPCHGDDGKFCSGGDTQGHNNLNSKQIKALETYQLGEDHKKLTSEIYQNRLSHEHLNQDLRTKGLANLSTEQRQITDNIDSAFNATKPLGKELIVYRGADSLDQLTKGQSFLDKSFVSTSLSKDYAREFSSNKYIAQITLHSKVTALDMSKFNNGDYSHEKELLLPRNTRFYVTDVSKQGKETVVKMKAFKVGD